jgi:hypothetical protein
MAVAVNVAVASEGSWAAWLAASSPPGCCTVEPAGGGRWQQLGGGGRARDALQSCWLAALRYHDALIVTTKTSVKCAFHAFGSEAKTLLALCT